MIRTWWALVLAFAIAGCSAAGGGGSNDPELQQKLQALKAENAKLNKQLGALSNKAFERASKAEKKRNLKGSSRVLRSSTGSLRFNALTVGPLKFKKKVKTFYLNIGQGAARGGLEDHPSNLSTKRGAATPADTGPGRVKKGPVKKGPVKKGPVKKGPAKKKRKKKRKGKKKPGPSKKKHNVIIHKTGGN